MKQKILFALWGGMFIICAILGFIPAPEGSLRGVLTACAVAFFLPPMRIFRNARKQKNRNTLKLLRNLSAASLCLTAALLVANFAAFAASEAVGNGLYVLLVILSTPMICGGYWVISLFLWAFLLISSVTALKKDG